MSWMASPAGRRGVRSLNLPKPPAWTADAVCAQADPDAFFPEQGDNVWRQAVRVCRHCPVQADCLDYALANDLRFGVWGGLTPSQRARRQQQKEQHERYHRERE